MQEGFRNEKQRIDISAVFSAKQMFLPVNKRLSDLQMLRFEL